MEMVVIWGEGRHSHMGQYLQTEVAESLRTG